MIARAGRYWRTLRYLRPGQLLMFAWRRAIGGASPAPQGGAESLRAAVPQALGMPAGDEAAGAPWSFRYLNQSLQFAPGAVDWCPGEVPRLWRYNLHYCDWLHDPWRSPEEKRELLDDWIARNPPGSEPAWEPYTASLRICNWIAFFQREFGEAPPPARWLDSLFMQAGWLARNLELHILANHLFENYKALAFAGAFFDGPRAAGWRRTAERGLMRELREQFLPDGAHYERAPMYHVLLLVGVLELIQCGRRFPGGLSAELCQRLEEVAGRGLGFLEAIRLPDQSVPMFNDSALGIAPDADRVLDWGEQVLGRQLPRRAEIALIDAPDAGLYGVACGRDAWVVDCGEIGPDYQPGHTHCDFLSYEWLLDGRRVVVDTGVGQYEPGPMRHYVRSTRAHNTVSVAGLEQSEVWGEFRVGRRARRRAAAIAWGEPGRDARFFGAYRGFRSWPRAIEHRREASLELAEGAIARLRVADHIDGAGACGFESYIHLHPDYRVAAEAPGALELRAANGPALRLRFDPALACRTEQAWFCPEFGVQLENCRIVLGQADAALPIEYTLERC